MKPLSAQCARSDLSCADCSGRALTRTHINVLGTGKTVRMETHCGHACHTPVPKPTGPKPWKRILADAKAAK